MLGGGEGENPGMCFINKIKKPSGLCGSSNFSSIVCQARVWLLVEKIILSEVFVVSGYKES